MTRLHVVGASFVVAISLASGACGRDSMPTSPTTASPAAVPIAAPPALSMRLTSQAGSVTGGGNIEITAIVTGSMAGGPAPDGTLVTFTAARGRFDPITVRTSGGLATTRYFADERHGQVILTGTVDRGPVASLILDVIGVIFV